MSEVLEPKIPYDRTYLIKKKVYPRGDYVFDFSFRRIVCADIKKLNLGQKRDAIKYLETCINDLELMKKDLSQ